MTGATTILGISRPTLASVVNAKADLSVSKRRSVLIWTHYTHAELLRHCSDTQPSEADPYRALPTGHHVAFLDDHFGERRFGESTVGHARPRASNRNEQWIAHILADQSDKFRHRLYARQ